MHEQVSFLFATAVATLITAGAGAVFNVWQYRENKHIDKGYELDKTWKQNVNDQLEQNSTDIQDIRETLNQNKKEDMAQLRVTIVRELKRCIADGYRTQTDNETIEPLLDIYFDDNHNGNGVVRQLAKTYHSLPFKIDKDLQ